MPVFVFFLMILVFVAIKTANSKNRLVKPWTQSALRLGGTCSADGPQGAPRIQGKRGDHSYEVAVYRRRHNRKWRNGTRYTVHSPDLPFGFVLRRVEDLMLGAAPESSGSMAPVDLGDPYFETRFTLLSDDASAAREYFDLQRRREIDHHLGEMSGMLLTQNLLQYERWNVEANAERITRTVDTMLAIADSLRRPSRPNFAAAPPAVEETAPVASPSGALAGLEPEPIVQEHEPAGAVGLDPQEFDAGEIDFSELVLDETDPLLVEALEPEPVETPAAPPQPDSQLEPLEVPAHPVEPAPEPAAPAPEPAAPDEPALPALRVETRDIFESLFQDGRMGMDIEKDFETNYAGGELRGEGVVVRIDEALVPPGGRSAEARRAFIEVLPPNAPPHERPIVVLLPAPADWPAILPGAEPVIARFSGRLEACEPYLRQVRLQRAELERLSGPPS